MSTESGQVGFIGLGNMGAAMATNLLKARGTAIVHDVNQIASQALVPKGAIVAASPGDVARLASYAIITMLPSPSIVEEVYLGESGVLQTARKGTIFIDSSTIDPGTAQRLAAESKARGCQFVDAPVSGGVVGACNATLTFMAGGDAAVVKMAEHILLQMGTHVLHCGDSGAGQVAKLCNNLILGITMGAVCEAMHLGTRLGVDPKILAQVINSSSGRSWSSDTSNPCPQVDMPGVPSTRNYEGGFACDLMLKDLRLAQHAADSCLLSLPLATSAQMLYTELSKRGLGRKDFSGIYLLPAPPP